MGVLVRVVAAGMGRSNLSVEVPSLLGEGSCRRRGGREGWFLL